MSLYIKGVIGAIMHEPERQTHVISIYASVGYLNVYHDLVEDPLFEVHGYKFDDVRPDIGYGMLFTPDIARKIILDYEDARERCPDVLVHCAYGKNRSPAVGIAMNSIFGLGHSSWSLREKFPGYNRWVYAVMLAAGRDICRRRRPAKGIEAVVSEQ